MQKKEIQMRFSALYVEWRTRRHVFLRQMEQLIDWQKIEKEINKVYKKGLSVDGVDSTLKSPATVFKRSLQPLTYLIQKSLRGITFLNAVSVQASQ